MIDYEKAYRDLRAAMEALRMQYDIRARSDSSRYVRAKDVRDNLRAALLAPAPASETASVCHCSNGDDTKAHPFVPGRSLCGPEPTPAPEAARCICDGAAYYSNKENAARHPFLVNAGCSVHAPAPASETAREVVIRTLTKRATDAERDLEAEIERRDEYAALLDQFAAAVPGDHGEHSSANDPWANALEALDALTHAPPPTTTTRED